MGAGAASRLAHDHAIEARAFRGTIIAAGEGPENARIEITVFTDGLEADRPELLRSYGIPPLGDKDRRKVNATMHGEGQLHTSRYRTISFRSTRIIPAGGPFLTVQGQLTMRGVTRLVSLPAKVIAAGPTLKLTGQLEFHQSHFGYQPFRAFLGLVRVRDLAVMDIYLEAVPLGRR